LSGHSIGVGRLGDRQPTAPLGVGLWRWRSTTGSDDRRYLIWKIREAEKGRIPVGPRKTRERNGEPLDVKILPLRLEAEIVERMDEAWRSRGIKNRMEFFRRALGHYLTHLGAEDAAALFGNASAASA